MKYEPAKGSGFLLTYNNTLTSEPGDDRRLRLDRRDQQPVQPDQVQLPARLRMASFPPNITFDGQHAPTSWGTSGAWLQSINRKLGIAIVNNWLWTKGRKPSTSAAEFRRSYQDDNEEQTAGGRFDFSQKQTCRSQPTLAQPAARSPASCWAFLIRRTAATRRNCGCATLTSLPTFRTTSSSLPS